MVSKGSKEVMEDEDDDETGSPTCSPRSSLEPPSDGWGGRSKSCKKRADEMGGRHLKWALQMWVGLAAPEVAAAVEKGERGWAVTQ